MEITVWYLYHSGFAVETAAHFLVFDYWKNSPRGGKLADGVIDPQELAAKGKPVIVFASHNHGDHYNPVILKWQEHLPNMTLVLSNDIAKADGALMVSGNKTYRQDDFTLHTLTSTDEGVAILLEIDGLRIYHAGDLNWWHWEGEPEEDNTQMGNRYRQQIDLIGDRPVDLAFVPVDPRLEKQYAWGIDYYMKHTHTRYVVPMHFGSQHEVTSRLLEDPASEPYRGAIVPLTVRGKGHSLTV